MSLRRHGTGITMIGRHPMNVRVPRMSMREYDNRKFRRGNPLASHTNSAHGGAFDVSCRACREIEAKQIALGCIPIARLEALAKDLETR